MASGSRWTYSGPKSRRKNLVEVPMDAGTGCAAGSSGSECSDIATAAAGSAAS